MIQLPLALAKYLRAHGGEIMTSAKVSKIVIKDGRATAVRLEDSREISVKRLVASSVDPQQLFLRLIGEENLDPDIVKKVRRIELGDSAMTIYMALDGAPQYRAGPQAQTSGYVHPSERGLSFLANVFNQARSGKLPAQPFLVVSNDSIADPSRAPPGKHLMKLFVFPVPYEIKGDASGEIKTVDWSEAKEQYADRIMDQLSNYIPNIKKVLLRRVVYSPVDLERKIITSVRGTLQAGCWTRPYQGSSMRPIPECGNYRTPVRNIYLCGAASHPGEGVTMAPGRNAAQVILGDLGLDFRRIATSN